MGLIGLDPAVIEETSRALRDESTGLGSLIGRVDGLVTRATRSWAGADSAAFGQTWNHQRGQARSAADLLMDMSRVLHQNAAEQRLASAAGTVSWMIGLAGAGLFASSEGAKFGEYSKAGINAGFVGAVNPLDPPKHTTWDDPEVKVEIAQFARGSATLGWEGAAAGAFGSANGFHGSGSASYWAGAHAEGSAGAYIQDGQVTVGASGMAGVGVHGEAAGTIGYGVLQGEGKVGATAGAWVNGDASVSVGTDGVKAKVGAEAMAGASATAHASAGLDGAQVGVGVTGYAGAGVMAKVEGDFSLSEVKVTCDLGVAVGLGAGVKFDVDIKPAKIVDDITHWLGF